MKTLSFGVAFLVLAPRGLAFAQPDQPPFPARPVICQGSDEAFAERAQALIEAGIAAERAKFTPGAPPLQPDPDLAGIAEQRACERVQRQAPSSPMGAEDRPSADEMVHARFGPYGTTGENVMEADGKRPFGTAEFARTTIEGWMNSPENRAEILDPAFDASGIGVVKVGAKAVATALFYGHPRKSDAAPCLGQDLAFAQKAEALIVAGIDAQRAEFAPGAPPLQPDPELARIAETRSCDMAHGRQAFSHTDEEGRFIAADMVEARFGHFGAIGENIMKMGSVFSVGTLPFSPEEFARNAVAGWMKSPEHRENILNPRFEAGGVGVAMVGDQAFATQIFWGRATAAKRGKWSGGPF